MRPRASPIEVGHTAPINSTAVGKTGEMGVCAVMRARQRIFLSLPSSVFCVGDAGDVSPLVSHTRFGGQFVSSC